ncbi:HAD hydrolase family protein [Helicobacter sp. 23-1045]
MIELLCIDVDGTLTDGSLVYGYSLCGNLSLGNHCVDLGFFGVSQTQSLVSTPKNPKNYESHTENPSVVLNASESSLRGESQDSPKQFAELDKETSASPCFASEAKQPSKINCHIERSEISQNRDSSLNSRFAQNDKINAESHTAHDSQSNNRSNGGVASSRFYAERAKIGLGRPLSEVSHKNDSNEYPRTNCKQDDAPITEISKTFNVKDGLALAYWCKVLKRKVAIITGKGSEILHIRASELQIPSDLLFMNIKNKGEILRKLKKDFTLDSTQIACVGDDLNDISMFAESSLNFAPNDCANAFKTSAKNLPKITILNAKGGEGAVREAIELILQKEQIYEDFIDFFAKQI